MRLEEILASLMKHQQISSGCLLKI